MAPIPLSERPTRLRKAVFDITLREGVAGVTQSAVAAEVGTSLASIRRWAPADLLPQYGLEWVCRRLRLRQFTRVPGEVVEDASHRRALNFLVRDLPFDDRRRDEEQVWWLLTSTYAGHPWFQQRSADRAAWTESVIAAIVTGLPNGSVAHEKLRLTALVHGATTGVRDRLIEPDQVVELVRRHVLDLDASRQSDQPRPGAA